MKYKNYFITIAVVLGFAGWIFANANFTSAEPINRKIVIFKDKALNDGARETILAKSGGVKIKHLRSANGIAAYLSPKEENDLRKNPDILRIDDDAVIEALEKNDFSISAKAVSQPNQTTPWGISRIKANLVWGTTTADSIKVAVIDTGIDTKHPDLIGNIKGGYSAVGYTGSYNDDNGHGTHVAGIVGAIDNTIGVIGVGPKIDLYGVKVLDRRGSGYLSDVIEGLDWAISHGIKVVNMSLGTTADIQSFHDAIIRANQSGIIQVAAAGNDGKAVNYPAAYPEVIAVSATDNSDKVASWSSRGPEVDLAAPGVSIYSTYKAQTYKTLSGTSMASPHVAGTAALVLSIPVGAYDSDSDGVWDPIEVQNKLQATAEDLGIAGYDAFYGHGLVDVKKAVQ